MPKIIAGKNIVWLNIYEDGKKKGYLKEIPLLIRPTNRKWKKRELENEIKSFSKYMLLSPRG